MVSVYILIGMSLFFAILGGMNITLYWLLDRKVLVLINALLCICASTLIIIHYLLGLW